MRGSPGRQARENHDARPAGLCTFLRTMAFACPNDHVPGGRSDRSCSRAWPTSCWTPTAAPRERTLKLASKTRQPRICPACSDSGARSWRRSSTRPLRPHHGVGRPPRTPHWTACGGRAGGKRPHAARARAGAPAPARVDVSARRRSPPTRAALPSTYGTRRAPGCGFRSARWVEAMSREPISWVFRRRAS